MIKAYTNAMEKANELWGNTLASMDDAIDDLNIKDFKLRSLLNLIDRICPSFKDIDDSILYQLV